MMNLSGKKTPDSKFTPDLRIAFECWSEKQQFYTKLPKEGEVTIKIKAADLRRLAGAAYAAGFERGRL